MNIFIFLVSLLAVSCYATLPVIAKKINVDIPSFAFIAITMALLSGLSLLASLFYERTFKFWEISASGWLWLGLFSFINFCGFALFLWAISKIPIAEYQLIFLLTPIISGCLAFLILGEAFHIRYLIALAFISAGLFIALKPEIN